MKKTTVLALVLTTILLALGIIFIFGKQDCERQEFLKRELAGATNMGFTDDIMGRGNYFFNSQFRENVTEEIEYNSRFYPTDVLYDGVTKLKKINPMVRVMGFEFVYKVNSKETDTVEAPNGNRYEEPRKELIGILFHCI